MKLPTSHAERLEWPTLPIREPDPRWDQWWTEWERMSPRQRMELITWHCVDADRFLRKVMPRRAPSQQPTPPRRKPRRKKSA